MYLPYSTGGGNSIALGFLLKDHKAKGERKLKGTLMDAGTCHWVRMELGFVVYTSRLERLRDQSKIQIQAREL